MFDKQKFDKKPNAYTDLNVGKYTMLILRQIGHKYVCIDKIKIEINENKFRYKGKDFTLFDKNNIFYSDSKENYYAYDFDNSLQIGVSTSEMPKQVSLEIIDKYVNSGLIAQIIAGLEKAKSDKGNWIMIILGACLGGMIGFFIGQYMATPHMLLMMVH